MSYSRGRTPWDADGSVGRCDSRTVEGDRRLAGGWGVRFGDEISYRPPGVTSFVGRFMLPLVLHTRVFYIPGDKFARPHGASRDRTNVYVCVRPRHQEQRPMDPCHIAVSFIFYLSLSLSLNNFMSTPPTHTHLVDNPSGQNA